MKTKCKREIFSQLAALLSVHSIGFENQPFFKDDNATDLRILEQSINEFDRELIYIVRPAGTNLLRVDRYFFPEYYIKARGNFTEFKYVLLNLIEGTGEVISCDEAFLILNKSVNPPSPVGLNKHKYEEKVLDDLSFRGFDVFLQSQNLEDLRRYAIKDENPKLLNYISKAQENISQLH